MSVNLDAVIGHDGKGGLLKRVEKAFRTNVIKWGGAIGNIYRGKVAQRFAWNIVIPRDPRSTYELNSFIDVFMSSASDTTMNPLPGGRFLMRFGRFTDLDAALSGTKEEDPNRTAPPFPWWRLFEYGTPGTRQGHYTKGFMPSPGFGRKGEGVMRPAETQAEEGRSGLKVTTGRKVHPGVLPLNMMQNPYSRWLVPTGLRWFTRRVLVGTFAPFGGKLIGGGA